MNIRFLSELNEKHFIRKCFRFDAARYLKHANRSRPTSADGLRSEMAIATHVVEKGLTMPEMRWGFGQERILALIGHCRLFTTQYGQNDETLQQAVSVLKEYRLRHTEAGIGLDPAFATALDSLLTTFPDVPASQQPHTHRQTYFKDTEAPFDVFSASRHSLRSFGPEKVPTETLREAVRLAQNAPSACNRQATQVYIVENPSLVHKVLSLQNGNRGFGQTVDKLIILTSKLAYYKGGQSRNLCYIDAGIYAMNLLYALHFCQVGACPLNWCDSPKDDARLRSLLAIPGGETINLIIACGSVPEEDIPYASSRRIDADSITHVL